MILIDKPYISNFLIKTIEDHNLPIISTKIAKEMIPDKKLNWIPENEAINILNNKQNSKLYTNSENAIAWIEQNLNLSKLPNQIEIFKNKIKFRELLKEAYPNYFFKGIKFEKLRNLDISEIKFPIIIKPAVGFFSIAVFKINSSDEWIQTLDKIDIEIKKNKHLYPLEVVDISDFIIEECIEGDEYAVDCYFDSDGNPVILNILHHVFSSDKDVSDRVYSTSTEIIEKYHDKILDFLTLIANKINLKNFPTHVEIRIDNKGKLTPIEINPMRFGGWCTTADLSWYSYGINSYNYFFESKIPDWKQIFESKKDKIFSIIILDNNSGIDAKDIEKFDYNLLYQDFENLLDLRKIDVNKFPLFGILFIETTKDNEEELNQILKSNLIKYITKKNI